MKTFQIAICDDSSFDADTISTYILELKSKGIFPEISKYVSGPELLSEYKSGRRFHCVILDMLMEPMDGISTAKELRNYDFYVPILIVTSTAQFALEGYQVNAWRYLVKPIDKELLLRELISIYRDEALEKPNCYVFRNETGIHRIRYSDIVYFESDLHTIKLHTMNEEYSFRGSISEIEEKMMPYFFFRVHKSYVVNLGHIKSVFKSSLLMENGDSVFLSKHRSAKLYEALLNYAEHDLNK